MSKKYFWKESLILIYIRNICRKMDFAIIDGNTDTTKYPIFGNTNIKYQILIIT